MSDRLALAAAILGAAALADPGHLVARTRLKACAAAGGWPPDGSPPGQGPAGRPGAVLPAVLGVAVGLLVAVCLGNAVGAGLGVLAGAGSALLARRAVRPDLAVARVEPVVLAGVLDLLAASLRCGLPVGAALRAVAGALPGAEGGVLGRVAELLALGAEPATAWRPALAHPSIAGLASAAIRTARSGAAMAAAAEELAGGLRAAAHDRAEAKAQRAGVLITGPLGLCFLPAFFCLGVLPVVIGLAGQLLARW